MAELESLEKIKEGEDRAGKIVESANEEKNKIIADARNKSLEMEQKYEREMRKERESAIQKAEEGLSREHAKKIKEATSRIEKLKVVADKMSDKEAQFLYKKFLEMVLSD